jgi:hypothetical protein
MSKLGNAFVKLDKILLVLFVGGLLVGGYLTLSSEAPQWAKKYRQAEAEARKRGPEPVSQDPEGIVVVDCIQNGKWVRVRMTRRERDALIAQQSRR